MAVLIDTFRVCYDAVLSTTEDDIPIMKIMMAYNYGKRRDDGQRPTQLVEGVMRGVRVRNLAPLVLQNALVHAVIKDAHVTESATELSHRKIEGLILDLQIVVRAPACVPADQVAALAAISDVDLSRIVSPIEPEAK